jgi:N-hydroxyarylamine O-acetyltransferase
MLDDQTVTAYLERIGATRPSAPDLEGLRHLQERQVLSVPFENLDYHLGEPVHMDERVLPKLIGARRGGGCFEVNPALAFLLRSLGYTVDILPGRVHRPGGVLGPLLGHLALRVRADGKDWLVDTGFGRNSRFPLDLASREEQPDPHGTYRLAESDNDAVDVFYNGKPLYQVVLHPVEVEDFAPALWWYRTAPESSFLQALFCSMRTEDGMVTIKGSQLSTVSNGEREVVDLGDEAAVLAAYKEIFGFGLDKLPPEPEGGVTAGVRVE